jgi:hypothetical protein
MKTKNMNMNIRKLGATLLGATMAGAAFMAPALAASDLQNYPAPFVDNGNTNFVIVVGANANPADIAGAINVAVRLGAERGEDVSCTGGSTVVSGGEDKELALNEALSTFGTMKYNKLTGYQHGKIRWNSKDVDVDEELSVDGLAFVTSGNDTDLGSDVYLGTDSSNYDDFKYSFIIDDSDFDWTKVNTTASKKLAIKLLGKSLEITDVDGTTDSITFKFATDVVLGAGETATVDSTTIKVNSIGQNSASITVGSETKIISQDDDEYDFGSLKVQVNSILYTDDVASRQVDLSVGSDIEKSVTNGDSMETFGEPDDENDAEWVWNIAADVADNTTLTVGAKYHQKIIDHKDPLKKVGQYFNLPNNYSRVSINSFSTEDYVTITGDFDDYIDLDKLENGNADTTTYTQKKGVVLSSNKADTGFRVNVSGTMVETDKVYLLVNNATNLTVGAFEDADNKKKVFYVGNNVSAAVSDQLQIYYQDTTKVVSFNNNATDMALTLVEGVEGNIVWDVDANAKKLGANSGSSEGAEVTIGGREIGSVEEDYRTLYGIIIRDSDSNGDSDQLEIAVPSEQLKATVVVEGPKTSVTAAAGTTVKKAVPIVDNIARLDTEVTETIKQSKNLVLVGGPAVNQLTAQALGLSFPSYGNASTIPEGAAMIKLVDNAFTQGKTALVVAGWDAENTRAACSVLQQFSTYADLTGTGVKVSGTTTPTLSPLTQ